MLDSVDSLCISKKTNQNLSVGPLKQFDFESLKYVCNNLRPKAREEVVASGWEGTDDALAEMLFAGCGPVAYMGGLDNPIYIGGAVETTYPGAWAMWALATEDFPKIMLSVTKFVRRIMLPELIRRGAWRVEARFIGGDVEVQKWIELIGAKYEATQKGVGKNGEDFLIYAWSFKDVRR